MATKTVYTAVSLTSDGTKPCHLCTHGRKTKYTCEQGWAMGKIKPSTSGHVYHAKCAVKVRDRMNERSVSEEQALQMFRDEHKLACTPVQYRGKVQSKDGDGEQLL